MIRLKPDEYSGLKQISFKSQFASVNIVSYDLASLSLGMHYHDNAHLCFLLSGSDKENRNGITYLRNSGDIFFYPPGQVHGTLTQSCNTKSLVIEFNETLRHNFIEDIACIDFNKNHNLVIKPKLLKLLGDIVYNDNLLSLSIENFLNEFSSSNKIQQRKNKPKWYEHVKQILNDNWNMQISLTELANSVHVHPITISKYFSVHSNCTMTDYIKKIRVDKSFTLLQKKDITLTEIAFDCGFSDQSHFIRVFKAITGYSPNKIRKACNGRS